MLLFRANMLKLAGFFTQNLKESYQSACRAHDVYEGECDSDYHSIENVGGNGKTSGREVGIPVRQSLDGNVGNHILMQAPEETSMYKSVGDHVLLQETETRAENREIYVRQLRDFYKSICLAHDLVEDTGEFEHFEQEVFRDDERDDLVREEDGDTKTDNSSN